MLSEFRSAQIVPDWPTVRSNRTVAQLWAAAAEIKQEKARKRAAARANQRAVRLQQMAAKPKPFLREAAQLAAKRTMAAYQQAGEILADLREALAGSNQANLAECQAKALRQKYPTAHGLIAELRRRELIAK